jgi:hypothetical protein
LSARQGDKERGRQEAKDIDKETAWHREKGSKNEARVGAKLLGREILPSGAIAELKNEKIISQWSMR